MFEAPLASTTELSVSHPLSKQQSSSFIFFFSVPHFFRNLSFYHRRENKIPFKVFNF
ncbi:unnamed protein product [Arabidopsis halleri]